MNDNCTWLDQMGKYQYCKKQWNYFKKFINENGNYNNCEKTYEISNWIARLFFLQKCVYSSYKQIKENHWFKQEKNQFEYLNVWLLKIWIYFCVVVNISGQLSIHF